MDTTQASAAIQEIAEPRPRGEKIQVSIERAARKVGMTYWRAYDVWYRKARRIEHDECDAISEALEHKRRLDERNEVRDLGRRLAMLEARLAQSDPDFHRENIAAFGASMRPAGARR